MWLPTWCRNSAAASTHLFHRHEPQRLARLYPMRVPVGESGALEQVCSPAYATMAYAASATPNCRRLESWTILFLPAALEIGMLSSAM
jgi:hypothetical protein